jgi:uncharacterized membrane protein (DUF485 family)
MRYTPDPERWHKKEYQNNDMIRQRFVYASILFLVLFVATILITGYLDISKRTGTFLTAIGWMFFLIALSLPFISVIIYGRPFSKP